MIVARLGLRWHTILHDMFCIYDSELFFVHCRSALRDLHRSCSATEDDPGSSALHGRTCRSRVVRELRYPAFFNLLMKASIRADLDPDD